MSAPPPRRVLVCPQEFKGTLDAQRATVAIATGVRAALVGQPDFEPASVIEQPMADGGPGTGAILARTLGGQTWHTRVRGAYGGEVHAAYVVAPRPGGALAVVESADAVGLGLTPPEERDPAFSSTEGVGALLLKAREHDATEVIVCVGGTATMDGGSGVARALGLRLLDRNGRDLPPGGIHLARLAHIEAAHDALAGVRVRVAVDARNALTGPAGAVAVYGSQKGLPDWQAPALDAAIDWWASVLREQLGRDVDVPGAGTGGGITAGILAVAPHATIESGAALVAEVVGLERLIASVDLVVTGEGSLDAQTGYGKTVGHVAEAARDAGVACVAVAGVVRERPDGIQDAEPLVTDASPPAQREAAMRDASSQVERAAQRLVRRWLAHHRA